MKLVTTTKVRDHYSDIDWEWCERHQRFASVVVTRKVYNPVTRAKELHVVMSCNDSVTIEL